MSGLNIPQTARTTASEDRSRPDDRLLKRLDIPPERSGSPPHRDTGRGPQFEFMNDAHEKRESKSLRSKNHPLPMCHRAVHDFLYRTLLISMYQILCGATVLSD